MLYFAYGSNLDESQMAQRCPGARPVGPARLKGHALCFAGFSFGWNGAVASIARRSGWETQGLLYSVTAEHIASLDRFEGYPYVYERARKIVQLPCGRRAFAHVYIHREQMRFVPGVEYLGVIRRAYKRLGFKLRPLQIAAMGLT
jgi:gamma-glutamylcyclotransferase (GGCT)/AIG2-like uncharacterized protein YtfP